MEENVCRICLQAGEEDEMCSIYNIDDQGIKISNKIRSCCGVKLPQESDGFPTKICSKCKAFLIIAYKLRTICRNSDAYLRRFTGNVIDTDYEEDENAPLKEETEVTENLKNCEENTEDMATQKDSDEELLDSSNTKPVFNLSKPDKISEEHDNKAIKNEQKTLNEHLKNPKNKSTQNIPNRLLKTPKGNQEKYAICPYCGDRYVKKSLSLHIRRHTGEKPYKCDMCESAFVEKYDLARHKRSHTGERPHVCAVCGKAFAQQSKLSRHNLVHTGERPYKCELCKKSFTQRNELNLHIRRHTGAKPYVCGICGESFLTGTLLRNHQKAVLHFEEEKEDRFIKIRVTNPSRSYRRAVKGSPI